MAREFSGRFSRNRGANQGAAPQSAVAHTSPQAPARAGGGGLRARAMFVLPLPFLLSALLSIFGGNSAGLLVGLGAYGALMLAAWLLHEGLRAEAAFDARTIARPPALPRKILAAVLTGAGLAVGAWLGWGLGLFGGLVFGLVGSAAHLAAFGIDPLRAKGLNGTDAFAAERVAGAIDRAEALVAEMAETVATLNDRDLAARVTALATRARDMFRQLEADPRDLPRARRYLTVYLTGARDATSKYAALARRGASTEARAGFVSLINDLEREFAEHRTRLLQDDRSDLDIEIDVLRERLKSETA